MSTNLISLAIADEDFRLRAFSDYTVRKEQAQAKLVSATTEVLDLITDNEETGETTYPTREQIVEFINGRYDDIRPDSQILLGDGYVTVADLLEHVIGYEELAENPNFVNSSMATFSMKVHLPNGTEVMSTLGDAINNLKSSYHSIVCLSAANAAMAVSSVTDRLSLFRDKVSRVFSNSFSDVSSSAAYLADLLEKSQNAGDYLDHIDQSLGITALAEDNSIMTPNQTDMSQYTGASPAGPLCFDGVRSAVSTVVNVGAKVIGNLFKKIGKGVKRLFNKAKNKLHQVVVNPYDLYIKNNDSSATDVVDAFAYQSSGFITRQNTPWAAPLSSEQWREVLSGMADSSYIIKFFFGEVLYNTQNVEYDQDYEMYYDVAFKPKPVTADLFLAVLDCISEINGDFYQIKLAPNSDFTSIASKLQSVIENFEKPYYDVSEDTEETVARGFMLGNTLASIFASILPYEINLDSSSTGNLIMSTGIPVVGAKAFLETNSSYQYALSTPVTNKDFIHIICGYDPKATSESTRFSMFDAALKNFAGTDVKQYMGALLIALVSNLCIEYISPTDFPFFPYRKNAESFSVGKFGIKTDTENQEAFNNFVVSAIVATVAVVVAVTAGVVARRVTKNLRMKRLQRKSALDNKMWQGEKLSKKEARQYLRAERRLSTSSEVTSGLLGSSAADNLIVGGDDTSLVSIAQLISGASAD